MTVSSGTNSEFIPPLQSATSLSLHGGGGQRGRSRLRVLRALALPRDSRAARGPCVLGHLQEVPRGPRRLPGVRSSSSSSSSSFLILLPLLPLLLPSSPSRLCKAAGAGRLRSPKPGTSSRATATWTMFQQDGPNHLGLCRLRSPKPGTSSATATWARSPAASARSSRKPSRGRWGHCLPAPFHCLSLPFLNLLLPLTALS